MEIDNLMIARQLMRLSGQLEIYRNGKKVEVKNALEALDEDQQIISGESRELFASSSVTNPGSSAVTGSNDRVNLSDLIQRLQALKNSSAGHPPAETTGQALVVEQETFAFEWKMVSSPAVPVEGLVRQNQNQAETDRYQFLFKDGASFTIRDKWTNRSTTIWGDPHVDLSDLEGDRNGEFSDLKSSNTHTTLKLLDGTRVTFTALDNGIIEAVDLFKGTQALHGQGAASKTWGDPQQDLFANPVTTNTPGSAATLPEGDVVYAAGDGNDWVDATGKMVWGLTTGPGATTRPTSYQTESYRAVSTSQKLISVIG
jgi:hypothetical protein